MPARAAILPRLALALALATATLVPAALCAAPEGDPATFVGSQGCRSCHAQEYDLWQGSHHDQAMQRPDESSVLGDFDDARFEYFGSTTRFHRRGADYIVSTEGPDGAVRDYTVAWVFGVYPLQQYLLPLEDGRLQALSIAWDARPASEGGQRWYHLYPDEEIAPDDPLHWTGPYQNWNTRCAECHSTDVHKNYSAAERRFATTFAEEDVACEACHGPGSRHAELAAREELAGARHSGFDLDLSARGEWAFGAGEAIARRRTPLDTQQQIDTCARCHARRGTLGDYAFGRPLSDTHRLSLLGSPLYHHDGQILDEVYVYGSFVQSKMHQAGVVCSNCHEPHSNALRASGNGVCAQCHRAEVFDSPDHYRHAAASPAAQCVACHMPATVYMGVDARRDHSMRIPRPDLSVMIGTPNACNSCHEEKDAQWSLDALRDWGVELPSPGDHPAVAMADLQRGDQRAVPRLLELAQDTSAPIIWRATALQRASSANPRATVETAYPLLAAREPLLRISAVQALAPLPPAQRYAALAPLIDDPVSGVRLEVASALAGIPLGELAEAERNRLLRVFDELRAVYREHADMPSMQAQLAVFHARRGDLPSAEAAYREALAINPQLLAAQLNLADLLRSMQRDEEAREQLLAALAYAPQSGDVHHALGLLEARAGNREAALASLERAAQLENAGTRHRYVYAVAQHDFGDPAAAISTLSTLHGRYPGDEEILLALANYCAEAGQRARARAYARKLVELAPGNPAYRRLAASLEN